MVLGFFSRSKGMLEQCLKVDHHRFFSHPFPFIVHLLIVILFYGIESGDTGGVGI
jgi:hypothetical protein